MVCCIGLDFPPLERGHTATPSQGKGLGDRFVFLTLGVQEADDLRGRRIEEREQLSPDSFERRKLGKSVDVGLGEDFGIQHASFHFELGELLEEGNQDLGDAGRIFAARDQSRMAD